MDEPFHVPQAQAYCNGDYFTWDPKITTPPGLYIMSLVLNKLFLLQCQIPFLRFTVLLTLLALPLVVTRLLCSNRRERPDTSLISPLPEAVVIATFPIVWFFGFLYYTDVPSLLFVLSTFVAASEGQHWMAALLGLVSCTFRQTNVIWMLYAYASSQLAHLHFRKRSKAGAKRPTVHDPPALDAAAGDLLKAVTSIPNVLFDILPSFVPYTLVLAAFAAFVKWNGGIVLGDKTNHIPSLHIPQMYYFFAFATGFGWPVLFSGPGGIMGLSRDVANRMFGSRVRTTLTMLACLCMVITVKLYTIHHPFLLSDNRHYTFYVWRRIYMFHPLVPFLLVPVYLACGWAWFLRVGRKQTLLQTLALPVFTLPTLLPTPLLEPRYFLIPYVLLRSQVQDVSFWGIVMEGAWYGVVNGMTMGVFLYLPREGVGRFMW
ncbi:glycosyltransferase family 59 protein [Amanita thiersii Skay4041]|uniref:Dol-P-Glc:Glc(2)Man(9)GlcNAc(2)-PP-Dol alpha-1,2-glucosyltransferase n=1 Tax=Amanita thiersii Skay4041 TaxID=703135 RepID=A0A2A9NSL9_9AGAR|nr:glycosyltransferase family 59 protein [Amanita thiersii Skay4041]